MPRFFFTGPRILGIRPGISFGAGDFRKPARMASRGGGGSMTGSFVYVIRGPGNHHKIGVSTDPIARLSQLQTGAPEPLDFSYIAVTPGTGFNIEALAHDMLANYRRNGEWFAVPASIAIAAVIESASQMGEPIQQVAPEMVPQIIHIANQPDKPSRLYRWRWALVIANLVTWSAVGYSAVTRLLTP